jgi:hypothetical protein
MRFPNEATASDVYDLTPVAAPSYLEGRVFYDEDEKALSVYNDESESLMQLGFENWVRVYNDSGSTITNGSAVYVSGKEDTEDRMTIALAQANASNTSRVVGLATHDIEDGTFGYITQFGYVNDIDTSAFADNTPIYLSSTVAGGLTDVPPVAPNFEVFIGFVVDSDAANGNLFITTIGNTSGDTIAGDATQVVEIARKGSAGTITLGQAVYVSGYNNGQDVIEIELADADAAATMPAVGLAADSITNSTSGDVILLGPVTGLNTSGFSVGDSIYISGTAGALTNTRPTTGLVQRIGTCLRSHASQGVILVQGAGRSNDIPNSIYNDAGSIASASTTDLSGGNGDYYTVTGTATITDLGTADAGVRRILTFESTPTLQHNGTSLILPGADDIICAAGDMAEFVSEGSGNWRCLWYTRASGYALDFEIGTWTPAWDFETTGNLSVTYTGSTSGNYVKANGTCTVNFQIFTSAFTHTTASGDLQISGFPFISGASGVQGTFGLNVLNGANWSSPAGTDWIVGYMNPSDSTAELRAMQTGGNQTTFTTTHVPTGSTKNCAMGGVYRIAA